MQKSIVTISREYGSGGRDIAKALADTLGYKYYDKELLQMLANKEGYDVNFLEEVGEEYSGGFLLDLSSGGLFGSGSSGSLDSLSVGDKVFILQSNLIQEIASQGKCVIVGRAADYILRDRQDCLNTFIYADMDYKLKRAELMGITGKDTEKALKKKDKARANHYNHYTDQTWGNAHNYDICLNSGVLKQEMCVKLIIEALKENSVDN